MFLKTSITPHAIENVHLLFLHTSNLCSKSSNKPRRKIILNSHNDSIQYT